MDGRWSEQKVNRRSNRIKINVPAERYAEYLKIVRIIDWLAQF
jgi:2-phosphoglycerate kinase